MKKSILITYIHNGDFKRTIERKLMLKQLTEDLESRGKELNMEANFVFGSISTFTDGSQIIMAPLDAIDGMDDSIKITNVYVPESTVNIPNGATAVHSVIEKRFTSDNQEYDVQGQIYNIFRMEENELIIR